MILFHRAIFIAMLALAFMQGAMDAGRKDMLEDYMTSRLLQMSLYELGMVRAL